MLHGNDRRIQANPRGLLLAIERIEPHTAAADLLHRCRARNRIRDQLFQNMARHACIAAGKHLRALLVVPRQKYFRRVLAITGQNIRAESGSAARNGRQKRANRFHAQAIRLHQMVFERHAIQMARGRITVLFRLETMRRKWLSVGLAHAQPFALRLFRKRRSGKPLAPWVGEPQAIRLAEFCAEEKSGGRTAHRIRRGLDFETPAASQPIFDTETAASRYRPNRKTRLETFHSGEGSKLPILDAPSAAVHPLRIRYASLHRRKLDGCRGSGNWPVLRGPAGASLQK